MTGGDGGMGGWGVGGMGGWGNGGMGGVDWGESIKERGKPPHEM